MINKLLGLQISFLGFRISGKDIVKHPLFSGSAIMVFGTNLANFIAYLYHVVIGRLLGPSSYGELSAILSILAIIYASFNFLGLVIVKFVSASEKKELNGLFTWFAKKSRYAAIGAFLILTLLSVQLGQFLHIETRTTFLVAPIVGLAVFSFVYRSFLQGLLKFKEVVIASNMDMLIRLIIGVILIKLGFSVFGTVVGILTSTFTVYLLLRQFLKDFRVREVGDIEFTKSEHVLKYAIPTIIATIAVNSMFSMDVVLVKHFFDAHDAGIYSSLSTLGKIIFYAVVPISTVMFPIISKRHASGAKYKKILLISIAMTFAIALAVNVVYKLFPGPAIGILFGSKFLEGRSILSRFGIFMMVFSLDSLLVNFLLSTEKVKVAYFVCAAATFQIIGIWLYHTSLISVISVSTVASALLLITLFAYIGKEFKIYTFSK
jgi:O-antigen/teichoic acid export membrane protein